MRQSQKTENKADHRGRVGLEGQEKLGARSATSGESTSKSDTLFRERVLTRANLNEAYRRVRDNKGAAGVDGMTIEELSPYLKTHRQAFLAQLRDGSYKPAPVKRVEIPKPDGSKRKLGIPTVIDRMVQQAVAQVITPVFEQVFSDNSFGFRPHRSAQDAVRRVVDFYNQGYHYVVDLDLKAYFDTVNHDLLMKFVSRYIQDPWLLRLIRRFLTNGIMKGKLFERSARGTPQGGNLSPLLANIYLNELDQLLTERGHQFVRYADDCNIYVRSERAGYRVLKSVTKFLEKDLKLTLNRQKTQVGSPLRLNFLGFSLGVSRQGAYARPSQKSKRRVKLALKQLTKRNQGRSLDFLLKKIKQKMQGWLQYYHLGAMKTFIRKLDAWLRSRIRQYVWKSWQKLKTRIRKLCQLGMSQIQAITNANTRKGYWRVAHSKTLCYTLTNAKLERRGLINMTTTLQQMQKC